MESVAVFERRTACEILGAGGSDHLHRRHLHRVSFVLPRDNDAGDFDLMPEVWSEIRCRLCNHDFLWAFFQIRELEGSGIVSLRQTSGHAVFSRRSLRFGARSETNRTGGKRQ